MTSAELQALLDGRGLSRLFQAVREAMESRPPGQARSLTFHARDEEEERAIADLHGWPALPGARIRLRLDQLDRALRESRVGLGLEEAVVLLGGPLKYRVDERRALDERREQLWSTAREHPAVQARPELARWLEELRTTGLLKRTASATGLSERGLLEETLSVVSRLPAPGVMLAVLATKACGDAHALDAGRPLCGLVLRAAAALAGWAAVPVSTAERRRLWAEVGVSCDPLSADVLTLGLLPTGPERLARHLRESSLDGEPRRITLRELMGTRLATAPDAHIFVCENPTIVAASADRLGTRSAALVCTEGVPSTAALQLLRQLSTSGARIRFHADFDWGGLRIGNMLASQVPGASPWRFGVVDYTSAAAQSTGLLELTGTSLRASWDAALEGAMIGHGMAIHEEQLLESLLEDLERT